MTDRRAIALTYLRTRLRGRRERAGIERGQLKGMLRHPGLAPLMNGAVSLNEALQRLPMISAAALRDGFCERNRLGLDLTEAVRLAEAEKAGAPEGPPGYSFGLSTGTSGTQGVFITSPGERAAFLGTILAKALSVRTLAGCRIALLLKHNNSLYADVGRTRAVSLRYFDIATPVETWVAELVAAEPHVVIGPPSVLRAVARSREFEARPLRPHVLFTGAEPLFPSEARALAKAFGTTPRPIYQAAEGFIAVACAHGNLHVNEDILAVEWLMFHDAPTHAVPVITDFTRASQDVWRVRMDDVVRLASVPCACGSAYRAVSQVEGRLGDVLYGAPGTGKSRLLFPFEVEGVAGPLLDTGGEWQIRQDSPRGLTILTAHPVPGFMIWRRLTRVLAELGGWDTFTQGQLPVRRPEVKRRRFVREIDPASAVIIDQMLQPPRL